MRRDEAILPFRGMTLWRIQLKLRKLRRAKIFISATTDTKWRPHDVTLVADVPTSRGPLSGSLRIDEPNDYDSPAGARD